MAVLIFVGGGQAAVCLLVTSAFRAYLQGMFELDPQEAHHAFQMTTLSASFGNIPTDVSPPPQRNDGAAIARIYLILSLCSPVFFFAMLSTVLASQWLCRYSQVDSTGGPVVDRARRQQAKMDALVTWNFNLVMEIPQFLFLSAFPFLGYALSDYLILIGRADFALAIGVPTCIYLLIFIPTTLNGALYDHSPYQTSHSRALRSLIRFGKNPKKYFRRAAKFFGPILSQKQDHPRPTCGFPVPNGEKVGDQFIQFMADQPSPLLDKCPDWDDYVLDANSVTFMSWRLLDNNDSMVILRFVLEVVWHAGISTPPLVSLYESMITCFSDDWYSCSPRRCLVVPELRNKAYLSATALLHVAIQRKCIDNESDTAVFDSISSRLPIMGPEQHMGDSDLEATLDMIDCVFGDPKPMHWQNFTFTISHHAWMAHILLYRAWDAIRKGKPLPDNIGDFALHSLRLSPPRPAIAADCLLIVGLVLGIALPTNDLSVVDKR